MKENLEQETNESVFSDLFTGIWVCRSIIEDKNLNNSNERIIYAFITTITNAGKKCWASHKYFQNLTGMSNSGVREVLIRLKKKGYIDWKTTAIKTGDGFIKVSEYYNLKNYTKVSNLETPESGGQETPESGGQETPESVYNINIYNNKDKNSKKNPTEKKQMTEEEWYESEERKNLFQLIDDDIFKEEVQEVLINQDVLLNSFKYEKYDSSNDFHQFMKGVLSEKKSEKNLQNQSEKQKKNIISIFNKNYGVGYPHVNKIRLTNNASSVVIDEEKAAAIKQEEAEKYQKEKEYWFNQINNSRNLNEVIKCLYTACKYYGFDSTSILAQAGMNKHSITMNMLDDISKYQDYNTVQIYIRSKYALAA